MKKIISLILCSIMCLCMSLTFTGCTAEDPYKDYISSKLEYKAIPYDPSDYADGEDCFEKFGYNRVEIFTDYDDYIQYGFDLAYMEAFFGPYNLLVFVVGCRSSDEMEFGDILLNEGKLYPMFYRKKLRANEPATDDFIICAFCAKFEKPENYEVGEIIYKYK